MRICIYGAGAMGTSLGAMLAQKNIACDLISRNCAHVAALVANGAVLNGTAVRVNACLPEQMSGEYDIIFLTTKQRENMTVAHFLLPFLKQKGALVTVQNGLPERDLEKVFEKDRIYGCTLSWGAEKIGAGEIRTTSSAGYHMALGALGSGDYLNTLVELLGKIGTVTTGNLTEIRYAKLAMNASFSTLSAISGLSFGKISTHYKKYALAMIREVFDVAKGYGCRKLMQNGHDLLKLFASPFACLLLPIAMRTYKNTRSGMLLDLQNGRRCDVDFVAGACVHAGQAIGVATPVLQRAVELVHEIENGFAEIAPESIQLLDYQF